jgi:hypothetical protein
MIGKLGCRFDWYEVTMDDVDDGRVARALALALGARITQGKGRNGYAVCEVIQRGEDVLAQVYGHSARAGEVHIQTSSEACDEVVPVIRRLWPNHRVSRADVAVDFAADFEDLDARAVAFVEDRGVSHRVMKNSDGGATRYLGALSSENTVRVYKKTEQLRAQHPERAAMIPDGIVRVEGVFRPGKRGVKELAARMEPDDFWGFGKWTMAFAVEMLGVDAVRVPTHFRRPSDYTRSLHFVGVQYGPTMIRRAEDVGVEQAIAELLDAVGLSSFNDKPF